ncbi:MAG: bacteriohemerythrin [Methylococcaceae bacterium]
MLAWSERFATHIELVDTQHKRLFDLLNLLADSFQKDGPSDALVDDALQQLVAYADKHFSEEEELMNAHKLDARHVSLHKMEHHSFMYDVERLWTHLTTEEELMDVTEKLVSFITSWLTYHILGMDQIMAAQIFAVEEGMTPEQAYDNRHTVHYDAVVTRMMLNSVLELWHNSMTRCHKLEDKVAILQEQLNALQEQ